MDYLMCCFDDEMCGKRFEKNRGCEMNARHVA